MKKIITSIIAGAALLFGFASCSGDLHDVNLIDLTGYGVRGTAKESGWDANNDVPLTKNADGSYSASFTATGTSSHGGDDFAIIQCGDASWSTAYRLAQPKAEGDKANVFDETNGMEQKVYLGQSADCCNIPSAKAGDKVTLTITPASTFLTVKVAIEAGAAPVASDPVPFVLSGLAIRGLINSWEYEIGGVLNEFTIDSDGNVYYVKEFAYTDAWAGFKLGSSDWANGYGDATITVDGGYATPAQQRKDGKVYSTADGSAIKADDTANILVNGLVSGKTYRMRIKTTPDKTVSIEIVTLTNVNMVISVTGLPADIEGRDFYLRCGLNEWSVNDTYKVTVDEGAFDITIPTAYEGNSFSKSFEGKFSIKGGDEGDRASNDGWGLQISSAGGNNLSFNFTESTTTINLTYANETGTTDGCTFYAVK